MKTEKQLMGWNNRLNKDNFKMEEKIKRLNKKLPWVANDLNMVWSMKDKIKQYKRNILLNQQQVRFNLMALSLGSFDK